MDEFPFRIEFGIIYRLMVNRWEIWSSEMQSVILINGHRKHRDKDGESSMFLHFVAHSTVNV